MASDRPALIKSSTLAHPPPTAEHKSKWHLVTGGIAGAASRTLTSPLERVKILRQCESAEYASLSLIDLFKSISKNEGWKGFFKGNGTNVLRVVPFSAIEFYSFERYKGYIIDPVNARDKLRLLLCGSLAGITASFATYPLDITVTYLALQTDKLKGTIVNSVRHIYSNKGFFGFYSGIGMSLAGIAPYIGFKMATFDLLKGFYKPDPKQSSFVVINLCLGAIAAMVASTLTYPADLIRKRLQIIAFNKTGTVPYTNIRGCIGHIYVTAGIAGFYRGLAACYLKVIPSVAVQFACNEQLKKWLKIS